MKKAIVHFCEVSEFFWPVFFIAWLLMSFMLGGIITPFLPKKKQ